MASQGSDGPAPKKPRRMRISDVLLLVAVVGLPLPLVVRFSNHPIAGIGPGGVMIIYFVWAMIASPFVVYLRGYRYLDMQYCTPEREIAAWRCDRAALAEFRSGMKERFPWTWPFRLLLNRFRPGAKGYVEFRFYPEGVLIDRTFRALTGAGRGWMARTWISSIEILVHPRCVEFEIADTTGRSNPRSHIQIPFPPEAHEAAERVMRTIDRGGRLSRGS
jgi:hypothetical protein